VTVPSEGTTVVAGPSANGCHLRDHTGITLLIDYFRCPNEFDALETVDDLSHGEGYFAFGDSIAYGRRGGANAPAADVESVVDISNEVTFSGNHARLPFNLSEVVENLRNERYCRHSVGSFQRLTEGNASRALYYKLRPLLPVSVRRHLQRARLSGWEQIPFPRWPVEYGVEALMCSAMKLSLQASRVHEIPFVWFWPDGASSAVMMTHDVEAKAGLDFCDQLMNIDQAYDIKSSFQIVPEVRYEVSEHLLNRFRERGFEVNVHDLNHDGRLFEDRQQFLERAARINHYARAFRSRGFRAGAMYRRQDWLGALDFSYDMSVPCVAHLEPQRGGCCSVMPYFVGEVLELPLTTIQDYSLFHILGDYSTALWRRQIDIIRRWHGLVSFITHPDYLIERRAQAVYVDLLAYLRELKVEAHAWFALPQDIDRWWRNRREMVLVQRGPNWFVEGPESHRARVAYASLDQGRLRYRVAAAA
jgi:hypothetical protein